MDHLFYGARPWRRTRLACAQLPAATFVLALSVQLLAGPAAAASLPSQSSQPSQASAVAAPAVPLPSAAVQPDVNSTRPLQVRQALALTLQHHARLQRYPFLQRQAEARQLQAAIRPNPQLTVSAENVLGNGSQQGLQSAELTLSLSQLIEASGKKAARLVQAQAMTANDTAQYQLDKADVLASVLQQYLAVLKLQRLQQWTTDKQQLEQAALQVATRRNQAGLTGDADLLRLKALALQTALDQQVLAAELSAARSVLAANWNSEADFGPLQGDLGQLPALPALAEVMTRLQQAPALQLWLSQERLAVSAHQLAIANGQSDMTLSAGMKRNEQLDEHSVLLSFSMPLPLQNPNTGEIVATRSRQAEAAWQSEQNRRQLSLSVGRLYQQLQLLSAQIHNLSSAVLPARRDVLQSVQDGYQQGLYDMTDLLATQQELLQSQRLLLDSQTLFHSQLTELERLTGLTLTVQGPRRLTAPNEGTF